MASWPRACDSTVPHSQSVQLQRSVDNNAQPLGAEVELTALLPLLGYAS